jgi:hypothetical protein
VVKSLEEDTPISYHKIPELFFNAQELQFMNKHGYTMEQVESWASMLLERDTDVAVSLLNDYMFPASSEGAGPGSRLVPLVVIIMLIRRVYLSSRALQILLTCTWHCLRFRPFYYSRTDSYLKLFKRFVRPALNVWPDSIPNIASLLIVFVPPSEAEEERIFNPTPERRLQLTEVFNDAIKYLSLSAGPHPYRSCIFQEKAQFMILSHMVCYDPPLQVSGEAFLSLAIVQLRRSKTTQEEEWSALQSRAWPPYPKPKTAMDEDKGYEFGSSRAIRTLQHMRQAGYSYPQWEQVARIYGGWDVDKTPTIQTRVAYLSKDVEMNDMNAEVHTWAARIAATRDVREAWSIFLQYETAQLPFSPSVYFPMFRKIAEESRRTAKEVTRPEDNTITPGDFREVVPPATSPMQKVFVASEPPTFMELFDHMTKGNTAIPPWFLAYLLSASPSIEDGLKVWARIKHDPGATKLIAAATGELDSGQNMRPVEFRGLIELLRRFPWDQSLTQLFSTRQLHDIRQKFFGAANVVGRQDTGGILPIHSSPDTSAIIQAIYLAQQCGSAQPAVWQSLLRGILLTLYSVPVPQRPTAPWFFGIVKDMLSAMKQLQVPPEDEFFDHLCHFVELAGRGAHKIQQITEPYRWVTGLEQSQNAAYYIKSNGSLMLRRAFAHLVTPAVNKAALDASTSGTKAENWIPRTIKTLSPNLCQHYIRALAVYSDYEGIYSFARWLAANESDMVASLEQVNRASYKWTVVITAFRVALEFPEHMFHGRTVGTLKRAPEELVQLVKGTLESMTELGGWASDAQVEEYGAHVKMNVDMKTHRWAMQRPG